MTNEEKMKSDFNSGAAFEIGEPNPYGKYFTGQSYLKMLAKDKDLGAINVTVPSPKKQTKNAGEKTNEKNDKYDIKLL